jgi:hypothetical protein
MQMNFVNTFFKKSVLVLYYIYTMHVHKFKTGYPVFGVVITDTSSGLFRMRTSLTIYIIQKIWRKVKLLTATGTLCIECVGTNI